MGQNKWRYSQKIYIWSRVRLLLRDKKIILNQTLLSKLWYIGQICTIPKYTKKEYTISSGTGKQYDLPATLLNSAFERVD